MMGIPNPHLHVKLNYPTADSLRNNTNETCFMIKRKEIQQIIKEMKFESLVRTWIITCIGMDI